MERTLVLIKPDGIERRLVGEIISIYEKKGINIIALEMIHANREKAERHYEEHVGKPYFEELITFITEGKLCALVIEGEEIINLVRKVNGDKDPVKADMGSIRGKYASNKTKNIVHASDSIEHAEREIKIWFPNLEL